MRHGRFHRHRQVDNQLVVGRRTDNVRDRVAYLERKLGLCARKRLGAVFRSIHRRAPLYHLGGFDGDTFYLRLVRLKDLLALRLARRIIEMHDSVFNAVEAFERFVYDMLAALRQHLNGHVVGDKSAVDQPAHERIFRFARRGKSDFYLLEPERNEQAEKLYLLVELHGRDKRLIPVAKIDAAPNGRRGYAVAFDKVVTVCRRRKKIDLILVGLHI